MTQFSASGIGLAAAAIACDWIGFAAFSFSMDRHRTPVFGRGPALWLKLRWCLRAAGGLGLGLSYLACAALTDWAMGAVWWFGLATLVATAQVLLLTYGWRRT
jgi:hypothetical protein